MAHPKYSKKAEGMREKHTKCPGEAKLHGPSEEFGLSPMSSGGNIDRLEKGNNTLSVE